MAGRLSTLLGGRAAINILTKNPKLITPTVWKVGAIQAINSDNTIYTIVKRNQASITFKSVPEDDRPSKFTLKGLKNHYELYPLVGIIGLAVTALCTFVIYFWTSRPELSLSRGEEVKLMNTMDLNDPPHLKILKTYYGDRALPELAQIYKEIENAENNGGESSE